MATLPDIEAFTHDHFFLGSSHDENARRTLWVVALTAAMMAVEIVAGYLTGSMALLADGFHMATHAGALGDWTADTGNLGYIGAAAIFAAMLAALALLYYLTNASRVLLFWAAFILTRPLGAAVGDFLDKPLDHGGLAFSRPLASLVLTAAILLLILVLPQRAGNHPGKARR